MLRLLYPEKRRSQYQQNRWLVRPQNLSRCYWELRISCHCHKSKNGCIRFLLSNYELKLSTAANLPSSSFPPPPPPPPSPSSSMVQQPKSRLGHSLLRFLDQTQLDKHTQPLGLLERMVSSLQKPLRKQHPRHVWDKHPCPQRDSIPPYQESSD